MSVDTGLKEAQPTSTRSDLSDLLLVAGYICAVLALVLPIPFAIAGILLGVVNIKRKSKWHGIVQIGLSMVYIGLLIAIQIASLVISSKFESVKDEMQRDVARLSAESNQALQTSHSLLTLDDLTIPLKGGGSLKTSIYFDLNAPELTAEIESKTVLIKEAVTNAIAAHSAKELSPSPSDNEMLREEVAAVANKALGRDLINFAVFVSFELHR